MKTEEIKAIDLLAKKDRRRFAELLRFAVEEYVESRRKEVEALRKAANKSKKAMPSDMKKSVASEIRLERLMSNRAEISEQPTLDMLITKIAELEARVDAKEGDE